jgi:Na+/H+ antiporter NhaD/arsenite permease-like protein
MESFFIFAPSYLKMEILSKPEFIIFACILAGVALIHKHPMLVALIGLAALIGYKLFFTNFDIISHSAHEWEILVNLFGLLIGFTILAQHFEDSGIPHILPNYLPDDWKGGFILLLIVFILSSFLDNIAAAMIGATISLSVFKRKVHIGYLAAIVAASNAGGAGSVVGDTTTTMMWISGVKASDVMHAYVGSAVSFVIFAFIASRQQHQYNPIVKEVHDDIFIDWGRLLLVFAILSLTILTNVLYDFPAIGVWIAILAGAFFKKTNWKAALKSVPGSIFLVALVFSASLMPVEHLPEASWQSCFGLGFISAVFDNIPLTKLALTQGGYDWSFLAYAVGFGGSMIWFGSSAGVALSNIFPEAKSVGSWIKNGWHVTLAYIVGFMVMLAVVKWDPMALPKKQEATEQQKH